MLQKQLLWLSERPHHQQGIRILDVAMGLFLWFRVFTELPFCLYFYGPNGIGMGTTTYLFGYWGTYIDLIYRYNATVMITVGLIGLSATMLIVNSHVRIYRLIALFCFWVLHTRFPFLADGGDNILQIVLFYSLFLLPNGAKYKAGGIQVWLHNLAVATIIFQVCMLYFTAGFSKAQGEKWTNGTALYLISQVEWFSTPFFSELFKIGFISTIGSYITIFFQITFPVGIFSRAKLFYVAILISMHLSISAMMGLYTFSLIMCGLELFLVTDKEWRKFRLWSAPFLEKVTALSQKFNVTAQLSKS